MMTIRFEWDEAKNLANQRKHHLSFEEAAHVFRDPLRLSMQDRTQGNEQRWQTFGMIAGCVILVVAHTTTDADIGGDVVDIIRIISARRANRNERRRYEEQDH